MLLIIEQTLLLNTQSALVSHGMNSIIRYLGTWRKTNERITENFENTLLGVCASKQVFASAMNIAVKPEIVVLKRRPGGQE